MNGLKLAVFNMDGTSMDSQDIIVAAMAGAFLLAQCASGQGVTDRAMLEKGRTA